MQVLFDVFKNINIKLLILRFQAVLINLIIISFPIVLYINVALLTFASLLAFRYLAFLMKVFPYLIMLEMLFINIIYHKYKQKQSYGLYKMNLKIIRIDDRKLEESFFNLREIISKTILILLYLISFKLFLLYLLINMLCILFDAEAKSIMDRLFKTKIIQL
ncbi:MAG: RDD family protein [Erysipelotrichaceae bacterium]